MQSQENSK